MDLMSARVEAATMSNKGGKPAFVILVEDEFEVTYTPEPGADIYARYQGGSEDKEFLESMKPEMAEPTKATKKESKPAKKEAKNANNKTKTMETATKKVAKKAAKKAPAKKAAKKVAKKATAAKKAAPAKKAAASNGGKKVRSIYGFGIELLEMLKKGGAHPMESLTKKFKVANADVSFQIAAIKSHGHNVERTDKGYKLIK